MYLRVRVASVRKKERIEKKAKKRHRFPSKKKSKKRKHRKYYSSSVLSTSSDKPREKQPRTDTNDQACSH